MNTSSHQDAEGGVETVGEPLVHHDDGHSEGGELEPLGVFDGLDVKSVLH